MNDNCTFNSAVVNSLFNTIDHQCKSGMRTNKWLFGDIKPQAAFQRTFLVRKRLGILFAGIPTMSHIGIKQKLLVLQINNIQAFLVARL